MNEWVFFMSDTKRQSLLDKTIERSSQSGERLHRLLWSCSIIYSASETLDKELLSIVWKCPIHEQYLQ
jgi:hypothetical protein